MEILKNSKIAESEIFMLLQQKQAAETADCVVYECEK